MAITRWNPFREMDEMLEQYARASGRLKAQREGGQEVIAASDWSPSVDITETDKEFLVKAEVPEVKKEDVKITVNAGVLTISGERRLEKEEKDRKHHRIERYYGTFSRSFTLPDNVREDGIRAEHKDGMLYVHLPKAEAPKPRSIDVKID